MTLALDVAQQALQHLPKLKRFWVGLSGGIDSSVLLHLCHTTCPKHIQLKAIHVNHGLSPNADQWQRHCQSVCKKLGVELITVDVAVNEQGKGIEDAARQARWKAYEEVIGGAKGLVEHDLLVLGHHADDQAETLLLNLLRGSGLRGAQGMSHFTQRQIFSVFRPMLNIEKTAIVDFARHHGLNWVDDESNQDLYFRRNFLRQEIFPTLVKQWPAYASTMGRFCQNMQALNSVVDEWLQEDLVKVLDNDRLNLDVLSQWSLHRQKQILLYWLQQSTHYAPPASQLNEFVRQINSSKEADVGRCELRFSKWALIQSKRHLELIQQTQLDVTAFHYVWDDLSKPIAVPEISAQLTSDASNDISNSPLLIRPPKINEVVTVRSRVGGERAWPSYRGKANSLKKIYQEMGVPSWLRETTPLIFYDQELVCAVGQFVDRRFLSNETVSLQFILQPLEN